MSAATTRGNTNSRLFLFSGQEKVNSLVVKVLTATVTVQGRYVCCDNQGCNGFTADNLTPHCKNNGYVPPNFGVTGPVTPPPTGSPGNQGKLQLSLAYSST